MTKYQEVASWIQDRIVSGVLAPGDRIPSENELCIQFNISRQTARHAIGILVEDGILTAERGSGTYVADERARQGERRQIAVVTTYVDSYIFPKMIQGIESKLRDLGYLMQIFFTNNSSVREREILQDIINKDEVAGILLEPTRSALPNPNMDLIRKIADMHISILYINSYYSENHEDGFLGTTERKIEKHEAKRHIHHVSMDDVGCAYKAVKFLLDNGHNKIGCVLKLDDRQGLDRFSGFQKAMLERGLVVDDEHIIWLDTEDIKSIGLIRDKIKQRISGCSALFCYNDQVSNLIMQILREEKLQIPDDISIISIDDSDLAQMSVPALDSIPHPKERLGERAAENLIRLMHHPNFTATYEFEEDINKKGSVKNKKIQS